MSTVFRFFGWLLLGVVVLLILALLVLRFKPQAAVALLNSALPDTTIAVDAIDLTYFPPSLGLQTVAVSTSSQDISVDSLNATFDAGAWRSDQPFWSVASGNVVIDTKAEDAPQPSGPINLSLPDLRPFLTFTRINVERLEMTGASPLTATLDAQGVDGETSIDASLTQGEQQYLITGTLGSSAPMALALNIVGSSTASSEAAAELQGSITGSLDTRAGLDLSIDDGTVTLGQGDAAQVLSALAGGIQINGAGDKVTLQEVSALLTSAAAGLDKLPLTIDGVTRLTENSITVDAKGSAQDTRFEADIQFANDTGEVSGTLGVVSDGVPETITHAPFEPQQLFPATLDATFSLQGSRLQLSALDLQTPSNQLAGKLTLTTQAPWIVQADLTSERLFFPLVQNTADSQAPTDTASETEDTPLGKEATEALVAEAETEAGSTPATADSPGDDLPSDKLFSNDAIDWSWINSASIDAQLKAKTLALQDAEFSNLTIALKNADGTLTLDPLAASLGDGGFSGSTTLTLQANQVPEVVQSAEPTQTEETNASATGSPTASPAASPIASPIALSTVFKLSGVSLEAFGLVPTDELSGGKVEADIALTSQGNSSAELAAGLAGDIVLMVEDATLMNDFVELVGSDLVMETLNKLNPFAKQDPTTELSCALVRFTADEGTLTTKNQLVMETSKMEIVGNGTVDLGTEKISLGITPNAKSGVGVNIGSAVKFLKLGGTLSAPRPAVSAGGLLKSGLAIGAAISTGGASVVAEGLAKRALNAGSACEAVRKESATGSQSDPQAEVPGP